MNAANIVQPTAPWLGVRDMNIPLLARSPDPGSTSFPRSGPGARVSMQRPRVGAVCVAHTSISLDSRALSRSGRDPLRDNGPPRSNAAPMSAAEPDRAGEVVSPPMSGGAPAPRRDRTRLVPILGWIRTYDRRWLRGDLIAGVAVAALIVPKNLGYAGIAGIPLQNGLYAAAAGAILYAVFGTSRQISTGPSSGLAAVAASAVLAAKITGEQDAATFVAGDHPRLGGPVPAPRRIQDGMDRAVPLASRGHGLPLRCRDRRRDRRAPQADGDRGLRIELVPGAVVVAGDGRRRASAHGARRRRLADRGLRAEPIAPRIPGALVLVVGGLVASRLFDLGATAWRSWAPCREGCRRS